MFTYRSKVSRMEDMPSGFSKKHEPEDDDDDNRPRRSKLKI